MKKLFFSAALFAASFMFGQLTLEHAFNSEEAYIYSTATETYYFSLTADGKVKIYNQDYSLYKTVILPLPATYTRPFFSSYDLGYNFAVSKNIFNTDNKFEIMIGAQSSNFNFSNKLLLINEDGVLLKDFNPDPTIGNINFNVYHDSLSNTNKLVVYNETRINNTYQNHTEIYALPTTVLAAKEIQAVSKLSAFPIPASTVLNISNPGTGAGKVQVFDASGKIVADQSFSGSDPKISIDVQHLPKGVYIYKIGNASAKFTKN